MPPGYPPPFDAGVLPPVPPRRRRGLLISLVVGGAVLVVVLALVLVPGLLHGNSTRTGAAGTGSASASPVPTPVSPESYQQMLDALDKALAPLIQGLPAATTPTALQTAAQGLAATLDTEVHTLEGVTPPPAIARANKDLIQGLSVLQVEVTGFATTKTVCLGSAALAQISQQTGAADMLRTAFKELATADPARAYHVGTFLPAPIAESGDRRLNNGTMIKKIGKSGLGKFKVDNKGDGDVVITLAPVGSTAATFVVYVRGKANYTVSGVPDGSYNAYLSSGEDWDSGAKGFARRCEQVKFTDPFDFKTTSRTYKVWTLTLDSEAAGSDSTSDVDPGGVPT